MMKKNNCWENISIVQRMFVSWGWSWSWFILWNSFAGDKHCLSADLKPYRLTWSVLRVYLRTLTVSGSDSILFVQPHTGLQWFKAHLFPRLDDKKRTLKKSYANKHSVAASIHCSPSSTASTKSSSTKQQQLALHFLPLPLSLSLYLCVWQASESYLFSSTAIIRLTLRREREACQAGKEIQIQR